MSRNAEAAVTSVRNAIPNLNERRENGDTIQIHKSEQILTAHVAALAIGAADLTADEFERLVPDELLDLIKQAAKTLSGDTKESICHSLNQLYRLCDEHFRCAIIQDAVI